MSKLAGPLCLAQLSIHQSISLFSNSQGRNTHISLPSQVAFLHELAVSQVVLTVSIFSCVYCEKDFRQYFLRHVVGRLHVALTSLYAYLPGSSVQGHVPALVRAFLAAQIDAENVDQSENPPS